MLIRCSFCQLEKEESEFDWPDKEEPCCSLCEDELSDTFYQIVLTIVKEKKDAN